MTKLRYQEPLQEERLPCNCTCHIPNVSQELQYFLVVRGNEDEIYIVIPCMCQFLFPVLFRCVEANRESFSGILGCVNGLTNLTTVM